METEPAQAMPGRKRIEENILVVDVFISYKRDENRDLVQLLASRLQSFNIEAWFDNAIRPGRNGARSFLKT